LQYGYYSAQQYKQALQSCRAMLFLCEHESQGLAYQECLASGVPVLAWDQGWWLDPDRFKWGECNVPSTSVPFFDERCGVTFKSVTEFPERLTHFLDRQNSGLFAPREYILENLTLEKCSAHFVQILNDAQGARISKQ
jgi:glycosyltransferase involved in cell wall biosynthesis